MARDGKLVPLYMEPPVEVAGDLTLGGTAVITVTAGGLTSFEYFPSALDTVNVQGDSLLIATQGGVTTFDYKVPPYGVTLGGSALVGEPGEIIATGGIVTGGDVPVTVTLGGTTEYCYPPSALDAVTTNGDAFIVVKQGGVLCVDYKVPPYGAITGGQANITTTLNGVTEFCYFPTCGITMGGEAGVTVTLVGKERGGKGTPYFRRRHQQQRTIHYYQAHAFFENTLQIGGEADARYREAPYKFIKSLPSIPKPDPKRDSEFVDLFKKKLAEPRKTTFYYSAEGGVTAQGEAEEEYFDFGNFILTHDEDLILTDILSSDGTPIITTVFDDKLQAQKREEEELLELLNVL
jgi:hypothetical protein